jgi:hypothetical protein
MEKWKKHDSPAGYSSFSCLFFNNVAQQGLSCNSPAAQLLINLGKHRPQDPVLAFQRAYDIFLEPQGSMERPMTLSLNAWEEYEPPAREHLIYAPLQSLSQPGCILISMKRRLENHARQQLQGSSPFQQSLQLDGPPYLEVLDPFTRQILHQLHHEQDGDWIIIVDNADLIQTETVCYLFQNLRARNAFISRVLSQIIRNMDPVYRIAFDQPIGDNDEEENGQVSEA